MTEFVRVHSQVADLMAKMLAEYVGTLPAEEVPDAPDPGPRRVPRPLRLWLARLRLLEAVPFSHLVGDTALLPPESIRFFHLDRAWTDALVEGALSVGTVTTKDRAILDAVYPTIRDEVDEAERLVRLPGWTPGAAVPSGGAGPVTGFLLRSRMVSGWPALSVRAYELDNEARDPGIPFKKDHDFPDDGDVTYRKLPLLRFERLAPAVLLVLIDGLPRVVHIEEPRAGIQFGVDEVGHSGGATTMRVRLRDTETGDELTSGPGLDDDGTVRMPFRADAPGVVHLGALRKRIAANPGTKVGGAVGDGGQVDAAELAMQLLQFPWRSVYGEQREQSSLPPGSVFRPALGFEALARHFTSPAEHPLPTPPVQWLGGPTAPEAGR